jgi:hypothetical protein
MNINLVIDDNKLLQLSRLKGKMLMKDNWLYRIDDYEVREDSVTPEKKWYNKNPQPKKVLTLVWISMRGYHPQGKFLGYMKEESVRHILLWFDLFWFRKTWEDHVEALQAFGVDVVLKDSWIPKPEAE